MEGHHQPRSANTRHERADIGDDICGQQIAEGWHAQRSPQTRRPPWGRPLFSDICQLAVPPSLIWWPSVLTSPATLASKSRQAVLSFVAIFVIHQSYSLDRPRVLGVPTAVIELLADETALQALHRAPKTSRRALALLR